MASPVKWLLGSVAVIVLVLSVAYASSMQNQTTRTTADIDVLADTVSAGVLRAKTDEEGETKGSYVDKDELIANLTAEVVSVQKTHPYDITLDYLFLDRNGKVTKEESSITGIQFRVQYVNKEGEVKGTAERRLSINQL